MECLALIVHERRLRPQSYISDAAACVHDPVSVRLLPIGRSGRRPHPSELGLRQHHLEARSGDAGLEHLVSDVHLRAKFDPIRASGEKVK